MSVVLLLVGLAICFFGIHMRKLFAALTGLLWGAIGGFLLVLIAAGSLWYVDEEAIIAAMIIGGILFAILAAVFDKFCVALNSFMFVFAAALIICALADVDEMAVAVILSLVLGVIASAITIHIYEYAFILVTAVTGGFLASAGIEMISSGYDFEDTLFRLFWYGRVEFSILFWGTLILAVCGFIFQSRSHFGKQRVAEGKNTTPPPTPAEPLPTPAGTKHATPTTESWVCSCGRSNNMDFCLECGLKHPEPLGEDEWLCQCGAENSQSFCIHCGKVRPETNILADDIWTCICGTGNDTPYCTHCGKGMHATN